MLAFILSIFMPIPAFPNDYSKAGADILDTFEITSGIYGHACLVLVDWNGYCNNLAKLAWDK